MIRLVAVRLIDAIPTMLLVLTLVFVALRMLPGDPALAALGEYATPEQLDRLRDEMGLNLPLWEQYISFLWNVVTLNFGNSLALSFSVSEMLALHVPYTIQLTIASMIIGGIISVPLGVVSATHRGRAADSGVRIFALLGAAIPDFYLGALVLIVFRCTSAGFRLAAAAKVFGAYFITWLCPR